MSTGRLAGSGLALAALLLTACSGASSSTATSAPPESPPESSSPSVTAAASSGATDHSGESATVKATAASLMAGALRHLTGVATSTYLGGALQDTSGNSGNVAFATVDGTHDLVVSVVHGPQSTDVTLDCEKPPWRGRATLVCRRSTVGGRTVLTIGSQQDLVGGDMGDNGVMWSAASRNRTGDLVQVFLVLTPLEDGWAAGQDLPVDTDTMAGIVSDPLIGVKTSPELLAEGKALDFSEQQLGQ